MLVTLVGISIIIFVFLRVVPGNIVDILFDAAGFVDPTDKANLEKELGLDQPLVVQYLRWIGGLLQGDLGYSYVSEKPELQSEPEDMDRGNRDLLRAGDGGRLSQRGTDHAYYPLVDAGDPAPGLHP